MSMSTECSRRTKIVLICGGIGSGKSVVSRICRLWGYLAYDCDNEARVLMDSDESFKHDLEVKFGKDVLNADRTINRKRLAEIVFSDDKSLAWLNETTHRIVRNDIRRFIEHNQREEIIFIETAIPATSKLIETADYVWNVEAPEDLKISRVMARNGVDEQSVRQRMNVQRSENDAVRRLAKSIEIIDNSGSIAVMPQIRSLIEKIKANTYIS